LRRELGSKRSRRKKEPHGRIILLIVAAFILAVLWVWKSIEAHDLSQELTHLKKTRTQLIENNKLLRAELERYGSIAWIDNCVRSKLHMTHDVGERMVLVEEPVKAPKQNKNMFVSLADIFVKAFETFLK
jgi:cell division protein FtsL